MDPGKRKGPANHTNHTNGNSAIRAICQAPPRLLARPPSTRYSPPPPRPFGLPAAGYLAPLGCVIRWLFPSSHVNRLVPAAPGWMLDAEGRLNRNGRRLLS